MPSNTLDKGFAALRTLVFDGAYEGLDQGAGALTADAEQGGGFQNVTEAERGGTVAYAQSATRGPGPELNQAVATVNARNPGFGQLETVGTVGDHEVVVVLTAPTTYAQHLETRFGGRDAALGPAMQAGAAALTAAAAAGIAEKLH
jgi:hypothetical protein